MFIRHQSRSKIYFGNYSGILQFISVFYWQHRFRTLLRTFLGFYGHIEQTIKYAPFYVPLFALMRHFFLYHIFSQGSEDAFEKI
jgi:hypothetical protein